MSFQTKQHLKIKPMMQRIRRYLSNNTVNVIVQNNNVHKFERISFPLNTTDISCLPNDIDDSESVKGKNLYKKFWFLGF